MSEKDIREERDELHQALVEITEKVAPFSNENLDEYCDVNHIIRAAEGLVDDRNHWKAKAESTSLPEPDATNTVHLRWCADIVDLVAPNDALDPIALRALADRLDAARTVEREREQRIEQFISILADCGVVAQTSSGLDNLRQAGEKLMSAGLLRGGGRGE